MLTITDGRWIILIGIFGWVGYLAEFGLVALPVLLLWTRGAALAGSGAGPLIGPVALLLAINLVDMLPNASLTPLTWLFAGAVLGLGERARHSERENKRHDPLNWQPLM
jgi:hypothetical protein